MNARRARTPAMLVVVVAFLACGTWWLYGRRWMRDADRHSAAARERVTDAPYPRAISAEPAADLQRRFGALAVIDVADAGLSVRALVLPEGESDYAVVFYRRSGQEFVSFGPVFHQSGFEPPTVEHGAHPLIRVRHRATAQGYHFDLSADNVDFVPDSGSWEKLQSGVSVDRRPDGREE